MKANDFEAELRKTLADRRFSRGENRALRDLVSGLDSDVLPLFRNIAFRVARAEVDGGDTQAVLGWLEDVIKALSPGLAADDAPISQAFFSPGDEPLRKIIALIASARRSCDICVFTITDNRIAEAIFSAHKRKLQIRIITDDDKSHDRGSDIVRLQQAGIAVVMDDSPHHMHHKFALFDRRLLLTGSYNWTRSAANKNQENVIVSSDARLIGPFAAMFDRLWGELKG